MCSMLLVNLLLVAGSICLEVEMETFNINGKEYSPGVWYIVDGNFIFMLNENGTNKFYMQVNGGNDSFGCRVSKDRIEALTDLISQFLNNYNIGGKA